MRTATRFLRLFSPLFALALLVSAFFINARKEDVPTDPMSV